MKFLFFFVSLCLPSLVHASSEYYSCDDGERNIQIKLENDNLYIREKHNRWFNLDIVNVTRSHIGAAIYGYVSDGIIALSSTKINMYIFKNEKQASLKWVIENPNGTIYDVGRSKCQILVQ